MKNAILLATLGFTLAGCNSNPHINQSEMCVYSTDEEAKKCKPGQMSWFAPERWGNERLPLNVAAAYCDFNYEVMHNNAGVICVFTDERLPEEDDDS